MAKYIIELDEEPYVNETGDIRLYRAKGFNSLVFDEYGIDKLVPYRECDDEYDDEYIEKPKCDLMVGDEVIFLNRKWKITRISEDGYDTFVDLLGKDGATTFTVAENVERTGYHFDMSVVTL